MNRRMGGFQYPPSGPPVHLLVVGQRPSSGSKRGRAAYEKAVQEVARREIQTPLEGDDLEVEMPFSFIHNGNGSSDGAAGRRCRKVARR